jgi:hypothetical protein
MVGRAGKLFFPKLENGKIKSPLRNNPDKPSVEDFQNNTGWLSSKN